MNIANFKNMDVNMLLSMVNMKLRDEFEDLEDLAGYYNIGVDELKEKMKSGGFEYSEGVGQFR